MNTLGLMIVIIVLVSVSAYGYVSLTGNVVVYGAQKTGHTDDVKTVDSKTGIVDLVEPNDMKSDIENSTALVIKVIDGDTLELDTGERVRLLGINTEERGQKCYDEAKNKLSEMIEGKEIVLEGDLRDKDKYNRLLRYVYVDGVFVNLELIELGLATTYIIKPNIMHRQEFEASEKSARTENGCIWKKSDRCTNCIGIAFFHSNAEGNDCANLNDEYVEFRNSCSNECDITGWTAKDEGTHIYTFPEFVLEAKSSVILYTGSGENSKTELYWNNKGSQCNAVWNNDRDTMFLRDNNGNLVIDYSYEFDESQSGSTEPEQTTTQPEICVENWSCSNWSECLDGEQIRACSDSKNCGTMENRPTESQSCKMEEPGVVEPPEQPPENQPDDLKPIINEIMYHPTQNDNYNEWVEIFNPSNKDFDLTDWSLCGKNLLEGYIDHLDALEKSKQGYTLKPNSFAIITDGGTGTDVYANFNVADSLAFHVDASSLCGQLSNSGKTITLENPIGQLVDSVDYTSEFANGNGKTLELGAGGWTESVSDSGTPGKENGV